jgi:hypothetical protein
MANKPTAKGREQRGNRTWFAPSRRRKCERGSTRWERNVPSVQSLISSNPKCAKLGSRLRAMNLRQRKLFALPKSGNTAAIVKHWGEMLLWRKRSDDGFKARVAPQRVPKGVETQMTIAQIVKQLCCLSQLFDCAILFACPRIDDR